MRTPKIGQFLFSFQKEPTFQILLISFVSKVSCLNHKIFPGVIFRSNEGPCQVWAKIKSCFPNKPNRNWSICFRCAKRVQISDFIALFPLKSKLPEPKNLHRSFFFVTLKGHAKFGPKLNPAFQISLKKISQFVWSRQKGSKFQILLHSIVWKVNCFYQKLTQEFEFVTLKGHGKFGPKLNPAFQIRPPKNWSICFQRAKTAQISYFIAFFCLKSKLLQPKTFTGASFCNTEGYKCKLWAKLNWILLSK